MWRDYVRSKTNKRLAEPAAFTPFGRRRRQRSCAMTQRWGIGRGKGLIDRRDQPKLERRILTLPGMDHPLIRSDVGAYPDKVARDKLIFRSDGGRSAMSCFAKGSGAECSTSKVAASSQFHRYPAEIWLQERAITKSGQIIIRTF
jgi:hypothetical protein